jgi:hypothetical protein
MNFRGLTQEMVALLSEAAVEIANLDDRQNIVYQRLLAFQSRLQVLQQRDVSQSRLETTIAQLSVTLGVPEAQVREAIRSTGDEAVEAVTLTLDEMCELLERVAPLQQERSSAALIAGQRRFTGSDTRIASPASQQRTG